ncbi:MarR family winged helix-turn-helix transcriptional regulator [Microlunatus speluncae]|uniref:MarR family winged helix-turn-helix transcriptional regulator n=1 Tax=Microlunatus speluncae TaxID=2594267 RepID=UPI0012665BDF|nr:MarR family transcriptional regulator [Microlunatus speluncae]
MIEETLSYRLLKAMKATRPAIWPVLTELGLHPGQDLMLAQLWRADGITQAELVSRIGVERPTVTKALQRLERSGYLRREPGPGRSRTVHLTAAGRALQRPVEQAWRDADALVGAGLSPAEVEQLSDLLARVAQRD